MAIPIAKFCHVSGFFLMVLNSELGSKSAQQTRRIGCPGIFGPWKGVDPPWTSMIPDDQDAKLATISDASASSDEIELASASASAGGPRPST